MSAIYVEITQTSGSAPRDAGTAMRVTADASVGTIGGGALEYRAIATARDMLGNGQTVHHETVPLGPGLGQCCGGTVTLHFTTQRRTTDPAVIPPENSTLWRDDPIRLWLWGAGHVGRAVVEACPPQAFDITWIDTAQSRFPAQVPAQVEVVPTRDMPRLARHAPQAAHHLIFTYAHDIDLALCAALLTRGAASIGLIGSDTKSARFRKRLTAMSLDPAPITCPIGDKSLGKAPAEIAHGVVHALMRTAQSKALV